MSPAAAAPPVGGLRLAPADIAAAAEPAPWGWVCGPRLLWLLGGGVVLWLAMLVQPGWIIGLLAWEAGALLAWVVDARRLASPASLEVRRHWLGAAHLGGARLRWTVRNAGGRSLRISLWDQLPVALTGGAEAHPLDWRWLAAGGEVWGESAFQPLELGPADCGTAALCWQTNWGLARRWARAPLAQSLRVYPDLDAARRAAAGLSRLSPRQAQQQQARRAGPGREFASLRPFRAGDEPRDVCWPASARAGRLVVKERQAERGEPVWLVLDCGRLMRARTGGQRRLGQAAGIALALASTAVAGGDRIGLLAYGGGIQCRLPPAAGMGQWRLVLDRLGSLEAERGEADHFHAAGILLAAQPRRALVIWLTELPESGALPEVIEAGAHVSQRHFLLLAVPRPAELLQAALAVPATPKEMYSAAAALDLAMRRQETLARLRARGARALELPPEAMAAALVRQYLEIKQMGRL